MTGAPVPAAADFAREQRRVAIGMAGALVTTVIVLGVAVAASRSAMPLPFEVRLRHTVVVEPLVAGWLVAGIANVARLRFFSARDIAGSSADAPSTAVREASAVLQNTLEQVVLAVAAQLAVTAAFVRSAAVVDALVILFALGRLLFWTGYRRGAAGRAFGFALTFYPSALALLAAAIVGASGWTV